MRTSKSSPNIHHRRLRRHRALPLLLSPLRTHHVRNHQRMRRRLPADEQGVGSHFERVGISHDYGVRREYVGALVHEYEYERGGDREEGEGAFSLGGHVYYDWVGEWIGVEGEG